MLLKILCHWFQNWKGIDANEDPGLDGLNSLYFSKAWDVVKDGIYDAIKQLFDTS